MYCHRRAWLRLIMRAEARLAVLLMALVVFGGCLSPGDLRDAHTARIAAVARPIVELNPDVVWNDSYHQLSDFGADAIDYLMRRPELSEPAAADSLRVLVHTSLVRRLANPATCPRLTATCFETTCDLLHFDVRVLGRSVGVPVQTTPTPPRSWLDLYPAEFNQRLAAVVDLEGDRRALQAWWCIHRDRPGQLALPRRLRPNPEQLQRVLRRRFADGWLYEPRPRALLCTTGPPRQPILLQYDTYDYNLVRAACVWLGRSVDQDIRAGLVDLVASRNLIVSHNARFALRYATDPRVRELIERYDNDDAGGVPQRRPMRGTSCDPRFHPLSSEIPTLGWACVRVAKGDGL